MSSNPSGPLFPQIGLKSLVSLTLPVFPISATYSHWWIYPGSYHLELSLKLQFISRGPTSILPNPLFLSYSLLASYLIIHPPSTVSTPALQYSFLSTLIIPTYGIASFLIQTRHTNASLSPLMLYLSPQTPNLDQPYYLLSPIFLLNFLATPRGMWGLSSPTQDRTHSPCSGNMGTAREVPAISYFYLSLHCLLLPSTESSNSQLLGVLCVL